MYQLANTYSFCFDDGEKVVIGPDPSVDFWAGHVTDISLSSDAQQGVSSIPGTHGAIIGDTNLGALNITIEVLVTGPDASERAVYLRRLDRLSRAYNEDLEIRWTEGDGIERRLAGVRKSQFAPIGHTDGPAKKRVLSFTCALPYIEMRKFQALETTMASGTYIDGTAVNAGTAQAFPEFRVYGPFTSFTIRRGTTTGPELKVTRTVTAGNYVQIKTKPQERGVFLNGSTNIYSNLDWLNSDFFGLMPGENNVRLETTGSTSGTTALRAEWRSAWLF